MAVGLALCSLACTTTSSQTAFMQSRPGIDVQASTGEMRLRTVTYARRSSGLIEEAATEIERQSPDPMVRKAALLWKLRAIPLIQEAALQPDPLIAAADVWVFALQMRDYFAEGAGREVFGAFQPMAVATCQEIANGGEVVLRAVVRGDDLERPTASIERFAREHPIRTHSLRRDSISIAFAHEIFAAERSMFAAVGDVEQTARDIDYRLGFLSEYMLKQARWTVELALLDAADSLAVESALAGLQESIGALSAIADELPALVELQRNALFEAVASEREATLASIDAQRVDTLLAVSREREAVFAGLEAQRDALAGLIQAEREAAVADLEGVVERSLEGVVDHAFWRLIQLGLAVGVVVLPVLWLRSRAGTRSA